jgi:predicted nucleic-acid-binding Zn-ribbon protein
MITIATVSYLQEADAMRVRLETDGIAVFLPDEFTFASFGTGLIGVRIQVDEADAARAREILALPDAPATIITSSCPKCGSGDVARKRFSMSAVIQCLLAGFLSSNRPASYTCHACGYTWKAA